MKATLKQARDEWIALRCQRGEPEAFADLVRELERQLLYFAQKLIKDEGKALDVLQEVRLKAFRTIRWLGVDFLGRPTWIGKRVRPEQVAKWTWLFTRMWATAG